MNNQVAAPCCGSCEHGGLIENRYGCRIKGYIWPIVNIVGFDRTKCIYENSYYSPRDPISITDLLIYLG